MPLKASISKSGKFWLTKYYSPIFLKGVCMYNTYKIHMCVTQEEKSRNMLSNTVVTSHMWTLNTCSQSELRSKHIGKSIKDIPDFKDSIRIIFILMKCCNENIVIILAGLY